MRLPARAARQPPHQSTSLRNIAPTMFSRCSGCDTRINESGKRAEPVLKIPSAFWYFRRLVAIAIIRRAQLQFVSAPRFIKGLDRNFSSK